MVLCVFCKCKYLKVVPASNPLRQLLRRRPSPSREVFAVTRTDGAPPSARPVSPPSDVVGTP